MSFAKVKQICKIKDFDKNTKIAGKDWFYGFKKKRHPNISLRKPEALPSIEYQRLIKVK